MRRAKGKAPDTLCKRARAQRRAPLLPPPRRPPPPLVAKKSMSKRPTAAPAGDKQELSVVVPAYDEVPPAARDARRARAHAHCSHTSKRRRRRCHRQRQ